MLSAAARAFGGAGVLAIGSSALGEPSWSFAQDSSVGLSLVDRFTHFSLQFLERVGAASHATLAQLFATLDREKLHSTAVPRTDLFKRRLRDVKITDFFGACARRPLRALRGCADVASRAGAVTRVELTPGPYPGYTGAEGDAGQAAAAATAAAEAAAEAAGDVAGRTRDEL